MEHSDNNNSRSNNNNKRQQQDDNGMARRDIAPDLPQMRSVMIGAPMAMPPPPRSFLRSAPSTIKAPPLPSAVRMGPSSKASPLVVAPMPSSAATSAPTKWEPTNIPSLPAIYPLERSHCRTTKNVSGVAARIADSLRENSLAPVFHESKITGHTMCNIRFTVQLFEDNGETVVEIQRRSGCCFGFRSISRSILQAAQDIAPAPKRAYNLPKAIVEKEQHKSNCNEALGLAEELLKKERLDAQELGMHSLLQMTRDRVCPDATSALLKGSAAKTVLSFLQSNNNANAGNNDDDETLNEHKHRMRGFALTILANCFEAEAGKMDLDGFATDALVQRIITELNQADRKPHNATQAARALTTLLKGSEVARQKAGRLNASAAIHYAQAEGVSRHALLEREALALKGEMARCSS